MYVDGHIGLQIETNARSKLDDFDWSLSVVAEFGARVQHGIKGERN
jgi:hypothetical protein